MKMNIILSTLLLLSMLPIKPHANVQDIQPVIHLIHAKNTKGLQEYITANSPNLNIRINENADQTSPITEALFYITPLVKAIAENNPQLVEILLKHGADPNMTAIMETLVSRTEITPLLMSLVAHKNKSFAIVKLLVEHGAEITNISLNAKNYLPNRNDSAIFNFLISHVTDNQLKNNSLLLMHVQNGHTNLVQPVLDAGADVNAKDGMDNTALILATQAGHIKIVQILLNNGANVNATDIQGNTPLILAVQAGHTQLVKLLLAAGANINACSHRHGYTALMWAIRKGHIEIVQTLLAAGANVNIKDIISGDTALIWAIVWAKDKKAEIVKILLDNGADVTIKNHNGKTAFLEAVGNYNTKIIQMLLAAKPDINAQDAEGNTALILATQAGRIEIVKILLENGSDINIQNYSNETALNCAYNFGHTAIQDLLLGAGAYAVGY